MTRATRLFGVLAAGLLFSVTGLELVRAQARADGTVGGFTSKFVDVNGVKARYYEAGQGEPMVLIHGGSVGGSSTANVWARNIAGLAKRFHVFAVDRLGCGLTGNPANPADYDTPGQVEFIYQFIKALKLGPLHLVGHSAGGGIAYYLATLHPEIAKTLVIVAHGPANPRENDGPRKLDTMLPTCPDQNVYAGLKCRVELLAHGPETFDAEYWAADSYMANLPKSKQARATVAAAGKDPERAKQQASYREQAWDRTRNGGVLQMPVLMFAGKQDVLDWDAKEPVAMLRGELRLFDIIGAKNPRVQMVAYNRAGHFMYREHPEEFNRDLIGFIDFWNRQAAKAVVANAPAGAAAGQTPAEDGSIGGLRAKFIDVNGVKTRYYESGQGEPMVLIHGGFVGGSSTANVWSRNIPGLARTFHVFALDRLGSGLTGNPSDPRDYETPGQVAFVYQFIRTLKLNQVHLVGHSAGGSIAFFLATEHPEIVRTLTIVAQGGANPRAAEGATRLDRELKKCPDQNVYAGLRCRVEALAWTPATFDKAYWDADAYMAGLTKTKEARDAVAAAGKDPSRAQAQAAYREKAWDKVRNEGVLRMPVLMFAGKQDVLDWGLDEPAAMLRGELGLFDIIGAKNPRVQMVVFNQGGHFMYREHVEEFNTSLASFIQFWNRAATGTRQATPYFF